MSENYETKPSQNLLKDFANWNFYYNIKLFIHLCVTEALMQTAATEVANRFAVMALPFTVHNKGSKTTHASSKRVLSQRLR